jgi:hypothetical protein
MHQASLIGEYVHDSTDYGWSQLEQGLKIFIYTKKTNLNDNLYLI